MKIVLLIALILATANAHAANRYLRLSCETDGPFLSSGNYRGKHKLFFIIKNAIGTEKIDLVDLDKNEGRHVRVTPKTSVLEALNSNTGWSRMPTGIMIRGSTPNGPPGSYLVAVELSTISGYTHGVAIFSERGPGGLYKNVGVSCKKMSANETEY
jgi:hypothetical protein